MFSLPTTLLGLGLFVAACALLVMHWRTWRVAKADAQRDAEQLRFDWLQFRRRMQSSGMIGLVGLGMVVGQFILAPLLLVGFWTAIIGLLVWIVLLALADTLATKQHFSRVRHKNLAEHAREHAALQQQLRSQDDGEA